MYHQRLLQVPEDPAGLRKTYPESAEDVFVPSVVVVAVAAAYAAASAAAAAVAAVEAAEVLSDATVGGGTHVYGALSLHIRNKHLQTVSRTVLGVLLVLLAVERMDKPDASAVPESAAAGNY